MPRRAIKTKKGYPTVVVDGNTYKYANGSLTRQPVLTVPHLRPRPPPVAPRLISGPVPRQVELETRLANLGSCIRGKEKQIEEMREQRRYAEECANGFRDLGDHDESYYRCLAKRLTMFIRSFEKTLKHKVREEAVAGGGPPDY
jgi:hypothetical protein